MTVARLFVLIVELGFPIILTEETSAVVRGLDHSETEVERDVRSARAG